MKTYILGTLVIILSSCSNLRVQVSTADPDRLKEIAEKIDQFEKIAFEYKKALHPLLNTKIITEKDNVLSQFNKKLDDEIKDSITTDADAVQSKIDFEKNYSAIVDEILSDYNKANINMVHKEYHQAVDIYLNLPQKFQTLKSNLSIEETLSKNQKELIITEISSKLTVANAIFHNGRANLLGDQMVSYITKEENEQNKNLWKSNYNRTLGRTYFGNTDIAIILNEMPDNYNNNYSIKGVRVDAAKLIQSTFDVMTQVVNVAASMSGIRPASSGDSNSFYPDEFTEIKTLPLKTTELENRKELLKESEKQLLLKILGEKLQRKSGQDLKNSVNSINEYWNQYKINLEPNP